MRLGPLLVFGLLVLVVSAVSVVAHKTPLVQYAKVGGFMEVGYSFSPRQPIVGEEVTLIAHVEHAEDFISGDVEVWFYVFNDHSTHQWYAGKPYKEPEIAQVKKVKGELVKYVEFDTSYKGQPVKSNRYIFESSVVLDQPGNYLVLIDTYEDTQYIGQAMGGLDIEQRSIGPLFYVFGAFVLLTVAFGVYRGVF